MKNRQAKKGQYYMKVKGSFGGLCVVPGPPTVNVSLSLSSYLSALPLANGF